MATGTGLDGDAKRLASLGQPLTAIAEIAQGSESMSKYGRSG